MLYIFEDNEAVIKMIIKSRSPTTRHVFRTNRDALDWSFDRINLDPKIQIKFVDTKHQLADILTKVEQSSPFVLTSAISAQFAALRISALAAAQKRWRKGCNKEPEKKELWQSRSRR